jgi:hypothetical protein
LKIKDKIGSEAPQWVFECGRFIFFEEKMPHPGKAISHKRAKPQQAIVLGKQCCKQEYKKERSSCKMEDPAGSILVFA